MEDLPRNLGKHLTGTSATQKGPKRQWTLLMVENQGKVISLGHIRGILMILSLILVVVFSSSGFLLYLYYTSSHKVDALKKALAESEQRIVPLRNEKDILMARLVVAEEKIEMLQADKQNMPDENQAKTQKATVGFSTPEMESQPHGQKKKQRVGVEEFEILYFPEKSSIEVKFRLVNTDKEDGAVSGYVFVLIRKSQGDDDGSIILPKGRFISGKPQQLNLGRYFVISRFTFIRLSTAFHQDSELYQYATVLIFSKEGELLLEKNYPFPEISSSDIQ